MRIILLTIVCALSLFSLSAQRHQSRAQTLTIAQEVEKLKEKHPDGDVIQANREVEISFHNKKGEVFAKEYSLLETVSVTQDAEGLFIEFYDENSEVAILEADGGRTADNYYTSNGIFHSDARVRSISADYKGFGDRKTFELEKTYNDLRYLTTVYFSNEYPAERASITLFIPEWMEVEVKEFNFDGHKISKFIEEDKNGGKIIEYVMTNAPTLEKEDGLLGVSHYFPNLLLICKKANLDGIKIKYFEDLDGLYAWYHSLVEKSGNNTEELIPIVNDLTKDAKSEEEKIKNIYYWVQQKIRYIAFEDGIAGFKPAACQDVLSKKYGDCKGMANLTKEMLKIAGVDARLAWLGTNSIAYDYSTPTLSSDNHMICVAMKDNKPTYLDATEGYGKYGEIAQRIQGRQVLIEKEDGYLLEKIPEQPASKNVRKLTQSFSITDEKLKGTSTYEFTGEAKTYMLTNINSTETDMLEDALVYYLSGNTKDCTVKNIEHSDLDNFDDAVKLDYEIQVNNAISVFGEEMFVSLDYNQEYGDYELEEDLKFDYHFSYKKVVDNTIELLVPTGYTVGSMPKNIDIDNEEFTIKLSYTKAGNKIVYKKNIILKEGKISKEQIPTWNTAIKELNESYDDAIILKRS